MIWEFLKIFFAAKFMSIIPSKKSDFYDVSTAGLFTTTQQKFVSKYFYTKNSKNSTKSSNFTANSLSTSDHSE
jgi:hypothetical protein